MNLRVLLAILMAITFFLSSGSFSYGQDDEQVAGWTAWKNGDVEQAVELASNVDDDGERNDLLFRCALVTGRYEQALQQFAHIPSSYLRYHELFQPVIDCYLHLGREKDAYEFAQEHNTGPLDALKMRAGNPLQVSLDELTIVSFLEHELTPYFPAVQAELEGKVVTIHVDTGGPFIVMNPRRAKELGIQLIDYGRGRQGHRPVQLSFGIARELKLGDAILRNVPVIAHSLNKHLVLGTNILCQFLSTLDYPRNRLILSPRSRADCRIEHMESLHENRIELPFYMWGDHYMFARGFVGEDEDVTFFMDSGLVALRKINNALTVQAGLTSSRDRFLRWGYSKKQLDEGIFQSQLPIGLGPLRRDGVWILAGPSGEYHGKNRFGDVQMHACLGHAWVKNYAWTLDFDNHTYTFSGDAATVP